MAMSKRTELASEKRKLRRIAEDEGSFRIRIAGMSEADQRKAMEWFQGALESQRPHVQRLGAELMTD
jgi:hypothetical protein